MKRRQRCLYHKATDRSWDQYFFAFIDYKGVEIWRCKQCEESQQKSIDNNRKRLHIQEKCRHERWEKTQIQIQKRSEDIKKNMWDCFVISQLVKETKLHGYNVQTYIDIIPKELIQLKRAIIKLQRLIDEKKGIIKDYRKKQTLAMKDHSRHHINSSNWNHEYSVFYCPKHFIKMECINKQIRCKLCIKTKENNSCQSHKI